jgi:hypothetical protein
MKPIRKPRTLAGNAFEYRGLRRISRTVWAIVAHSAATQHETLFSRQAWEEMAH